MKLFSPLLVLIGLICAIKGSQLCFKEDLNIDMEGNNILIHLETPDFESCCRLCKSNRDALHGMTCKGFVWNGNTCYVKNNIDTNKIIDKSGYRFGIVESCSNDGVSSCSASSNPSCPGGNCACKIALPDLGNEIANTQLDPRPQNCDAENNCEIPSGTSTTLNVQITEICRNWHSSEFSVRGDDVVVSISGDPYHKRLESKCIGYETEPWYGGGDTQLGVDYQPVSFHLTCNNGKVEARVEAWRKPFRQFNDNHPLPQHWQTVTGIERIQCGPCSPWNERIPPLVKVTGRTANTFGFEEPSDGAQCTGLGNVKTCSLRNGVNRRGPGTFITYQGDCPNDLVRIRGRNMDCESGNSALEFPKTFARMIIWQPNCMTLDMRSKSQPNVNARGMTLVDIEDRKLDLTNNLGLSFLFMKAWVAPADPSIKPIPNMACGNVEYIECGTCPTNFVD